MLEFLGLEQAAENLERAVAEVLAEGAALPNDLGGTASTSAVTDAVLAKLD
jgi:isocitrate/isopropylmalate dehydrogenase